MYRTLIMYYLYKLLLFFKYKMISINFIFCKFIFKFIDGIFVNLFLIHHLYFKLQETIANKLKII